MDIGEWPGVMGNLAPQFRHLRAIRLASAIYHIAGNFGGVKFSRMASAQISLSHLDHVLEMRRAS